MELGQIVYWRGVALLYRLLGVVSFQLRTGEVFLALFLLVCEVLAALYTPCMLCGFFASCYTILVYLSKKKKKNNKKLK